MYEKLHDVLMWMIRLPYVRFVVINPTWTLLQFNPGLVSVVFPQVVLVVSFICWTVF